MSLCSRCGSDQSASMAREVFTDSAAMAQALQPVVGPKGRSFILYDEAEKASKTKCDPEKIVPNYDFLDALHKLSNNLAFTKKAWEAAITIIYGLNKETPSWTLAAAHMDDYVKTMTRRCINICRAVNQAERKAKTCGRNCPVWVSNLPWFEIPVKKRPATKEEDGPEWVYGYDKNLCLAWKMDMTLAKPARIMSMPLEPPSNPQGHAAMVATWPDGDQKEVAECTFQEYEDQKAHHHRETDKFWTGEHIITHHTLTVQLRSDRGDTKL
eukprot:4296998-Lingulodinium_polyedra.AAC.1